MGVLDRLGWRIDPLASAGRELAELLADHRRTARELDEAGVEFVLLTEPQPTDAPGGDRVTASLDPVALAPALLAASRRISVISALNPALYDPYLAARQIASLFHASSGRAGLALQPSLHPELVASVTSLQRIPRDRGEVLARTAEWVHAIRSLWRSWDADAVIEDLDRWVYADHARIHRVDIVGEYFSLAGPSETLPFRDREPLVLAGAHYDGDLDTASLALADLIHVDGPNAEALLAAEAAVRSGLAAIPRIGGGPLLFAVVDGSSPEGLVAAARLLDEQGGYDGLLIDAGVERAAVNAVLDVAIPALRAGR